MVTLSNKNYRDIFRPDDRALQEIVVFDVDSHDWQHLLEYLARNYLVVYTEDGHQVALPSIEGIWSAQTERSVTLEIVLAGFTINCHFVVRDQITMNVLPEDVDSQAKADAVLHLMVELAGVLNKEVFLTPEFGSAEPDELRRMAICFADPSSHSVRCER
jgi:hypothetical protein